jgi:hypothetical protein
MKKYFILLSFLSIALFSCQQKSEDSDSTEKVEIVESNSPVTSIFSDDNEYFPAKAGVSWTYGYATEFQTGMKNPTYTIEITDDEYEQNGETSLIMKQKRLGDDDQIKVDMTMYIRVDDDGNVYSFIPQMMEKEGLAMPSEISAGKTWQVNKVGKATVLDMNGSLKTPAESYDNCLVLETDLGGGSKMVSYYVKGIGSVATEMDH